MSTLTEPCRLLDLRITQGLFFGGVVEQEQHNSLERAYCKLLVSLGESSA